MEALKVKSCFSGIIRSTQFGQIQNPQVMCLIWKTMYSASQKRRLDITRYAAMWPVYKELADIDQDTVPLLQKGFPRIQNLPPVEHLLSKTQRLCPTCPIVYHRISE